MVSSKWDFDQFINNQLLLRDGKLCVTLFQKFSGDVISYVVLFLHKKYHHLKTLGTIKVLSSMNISHGIIMSMIYVKKNCFGLRKLWTCSHFTPTIIRRQLILALILLFIHAQEIYLELSVINR